MARDTDRLDWAQDGADWPLRQHSRFVQAGGLGWHVQQLGDGPVALLLHGAGGASCSWRGVAPLLAAGFTVIAPDLPGHGFTDPAPRGGATLPGMARALAALLAAMGAQPALAVGHSAGAAVLARMTLDGLIAPRALVAVNGAFLPFDGLAGLMFPPMARLLAQNPLASRVMAAAARGAAGRLLDSMGLGEDAQGRALYGRLFARPGHVAGALAMMAGWDLAPLARDLPRLRPAPVLLVGEADRAVPPAQARRVADRIPGAALRLLPGLGHLAHEQRPDLAAALIRDAFAAAP